MISWGSKLLLNQSQIFQKLMWKKNTVHSVTSVYRTFASLPIMFEEKSVLLPAASKLFKGASIPWQNSVRTTTRGRDFQPNTYRRIKKHGLQKRMRTINGRIVIIKRMMKGVPRRELTH